MLPMSFLRLFFASPEPVRTAHPPADRELTAVAAALLRGIGCDAIADRVVVRWNSRLSSSAGLARPSTMTVSLNPKLKAFPAEVDRTLRHELAHLVAFARAGRTRIAAHGAQWRQACAQLGIPGESRCHALPLSGRSLDRPHVYRCPNCGFILRRVRRIDWRRRLLACRECCQKHARGRFDARFKFVEIGPQEVSAAG
jgi:SprT protein